MRMQQTSKQTGACWQLHARVPYNCPGVPCTEDALCCYFKTSLNPQTQYKWGCFPDSCDPSSSHSLPPTSILRCPFPLTFLLMFCYPVYAVVSHILKHCVCSGCQKEAGLDFLSWNACNWAWELWGYNCEECSLLLDLADSYTCFGILKWRQGMRENITKRRFIHDDFSHLRIWM
jgi:hypothetical protein